MHKTTRFFQLLSYLQYPLMLSALIFYVPFIMSMLDKSIQWSHLNNGLILYGLSLSFSTLQDTTTTQNNFSKKIWQHPVKGQVMLWVITVMAFGLIITGLLAMFYFNLGPAKDVAVGILVLGIGMLGLLKVAIEMFENHRLDKNPNQDISQTEQASLKKLPKLPR